MTFVLHALGELMWPWPSIGRLTVGVADRLRSAYRAAYAATGALDGFWIGPVSDEWLWEYHTTAGRGGDEP